ncbi:MAG: Hsp20/alpha crystallin family protein [Gammaproteobacteria bacterium]|nr:Hsp20/alpha crystallin family protein [Gammaproteobacteria bacterium]MCF6231224.1 Hsp20/alpha crystallin family protein [Gammaproteobacteria bacterium]
MAKNKKVKNRGKLSSATKGGEFQHPPRRATNPFEEIDRVFESVSPRGWMQPLRQEWPAWASLEAPFDGYAPKVDVVAHDNEVVVRAELPGVDKKNLDISVTADSVTIKAFTRQESNEDKGDYHRREISRGSFVRTVALPASVQSKKAKASFKNGVLKLKLPKAAPTRRHSIKVD